MAKTTQSHLLYKGNLLPWYEEAIVKLKTGNFDALDIDGGKIGGGECCFVYIFCHSGFPELKFYCKMSGNG